MKHSLFRSILALVLAATMLAGQGISAMAGVEDEVPILDESLISEDPTPTQAPEGEETDPLVDPQEQNPENALTDPTVIDPEVSEEQPVTTYALLDTNDLENDGISLIVESSLNPGDKVKDGETVVFDVFVKDGNPTREPNISEGSELLITLPAYLEINDVASFLENSTFFKEVYYNEESHSLRLVFKAAMGNVVDFSFSVSTQVNAIGYVGRTNGDVTVGMGDVQSGVTPDSTGVELDTGIGTGDGSGSGDGSGEDKPYLRKTIWSNYKPSEYGTNDYVIVRESNQPVGYSITVGVQKNYENRIVITDDLGAGSMSLCNPAGVTDVPIRDCVYVKIGEATYYDGDTVPELGNLSIVKNGSGFDVVFSRSGPTPNDNSLVRMQICYFVLLSADVENISNTATLSINGEMADSDSSIIVHREIQQLSVLKSIWDKPNNRSVPAIDLGFEEQEVTFRITFTQYGPSRNRVDGEEFVLDMLEDCFIFDPDKVTGSDLFRLEPDGQAIHVVKNGAGKIPTGTHHIDFTVKIDPSKLLPGQEAENTIGNSTVIIRRPAKITINKIWEDEGDKKKGDGARFILLKDNEPIADSGAYSDGNRFELIFWSDQLKEGDYTYTLKEEVAENSDYMAGRDLPVVINKTDGKITIKSIDGIRIDSGDRADVTTTVTNMPDSGMGSLIFKKLGENNELLTGGSYKLFREENGVETLIAEFTMTADEKVFEGLPYGTYFVREISAPEGYVLHAESPDSDKVELKKTERNQTLQLRNEKYRDGEIKIVKKDQEGKSLSGVGFTLTSAADNRSITAETNENGEASFTGLEAGVYSIKETVPFGYSGFEEAIMVTIKADGGIQEVTAGPNVSVEGRRITITWINTLLTGELKIVKSDGSTGAKLAGAKFVLTGGSIEREGWTNDNGELSFRDLPYGRYVLREAEAPIGYNISAELSAGIYVDIVRPTVTLPLQNSQKTGSITIIKRDGGDHSKTLSGAQFGLFDSDPAANPAASPIDTKITDANGRCRFEQLKSGTYYVKELIAPVGYALSEQVLTFALGVTEDNEEGEWDLSADFDNAKKLYSIKLVKTNEDESQKLSGAVFTLSGNGIEQTEASDRNGVVLFENVPYGVYTVRETVAPDGYVPVEPFTVTVDDSTTPRAYAVGQTVNWGGGAVKNSHTKLKVLKVDDLAPHKGLPGTTFVIMSGEQYVTAAGGNGAYTFTGFAAEGTEFVTGEGGIFTLDYIPMGSYTLRETAAPTGYIIAEEEKVFEIKQADSTVTVGNTQVRAELKLIKTDDRGKLLENIGFTLSTAEGYVQASGQPGSYSFTEFGPEPCVMYTSESGELHVRDLLWGTYTVDEAENTPEGLISLHNEHFTVSDSDHGKVIVFEAVNKRLTGDITLHKVDKDHAPLPGAVFKALCIKGTDYSDTEVRYAVSDETGRVTFKNLPFGVYEVSEFLAPYGYECSDETYYISVCEAEAPENIELSKDPVTCVNYERQIEVSVMKVSSSGEALVGLEFSIEDENHEPVTFENENGELVTRLSITDPDSNGTAVIKLPAGNYYLVEETAPANYIKLDHPVPFTVAEGRLNKIVLANEPYTGALRVLKKDQDGAALGGAEFAVYDAMDYSRRGADAEVLYSLVTNSLGTAELSGIPFGDYTILETKAPAGYAPAPDAQTFRIDQKAEAVVELEFVNELLRYAFQIAKQDINSGALLPGASFLVYGDRLHTTVTVGEDGTALVEVPGPGIYYVVEIGAPEGYTIDPTVYKVEVTEPLSSGVTFNANFVSRDYPTELRLYKVDENNELMDGAVFVLYDEAGAPVGVSGSDGAYVYDPASENVEIPAGSVSVKNLPLGSYTLHELSAPEGYMPLGDISFRFDGSEFDEPVVITAANFPYQRGVAVCKENEAGVRLSGAEFTLYNGDGEVVMTKTTAASGYAVFPELRSGSYRIEETKAPVGYLPYDTAIEFTIDGDGVLTGDGFVNYGTAELPFYVITVTDKPVTYSFKIVKVSSMNGALLDNARFRIIGSGVNMTVATVNGYAEIKDLPVGEYMLTELMAPAGYAADAAGHFVTVSPEGVTVDGVALEAGVMEYEVKNDPLPFELRIEKLDEDSRKPLEGAAFTVTGPDGGKHYLITDAGGQTETISLMPGEYTVIESVAPKGYNVPLAGWRFTVEEGSMRILLTDGQSDMRMEGNTLKLILTNKRTSGSLLINKVDESNGNAPLADARFRILKENGEYVSFTLVNGIYHAASPSAAGAGNVVKTNAMGQCLIEDLEFGTYTVREVRAPVGYRIKTEGQLIKLTDQDETFKLSFSNEQLTRSVSVMKQSAGENPEKLIGAVFALYTVKDGKPADFVAESTTLYDGIARFTVPYGDYLIVETRAPEGYELSDQPPVAFSYNADTPEDEPFTFTFTNEKTRYAIEVYKYDESDPAKALQGAKFAFTDSRGYTKIVETGADGIARLEDVAFDDFTVREVSAPEGYYLNEQEYVVHREDLKHNAVVRIEAPNRYILGSVHLKKVDLEDKTKVLDAEFVITDAAGNELKWLETEDGYECAESGEAVIHAGNIRLTKIPAGDYVITEVNTPEGYLKLEEGRRFSITADNAEAGIKITIKNLIRKVAVGIIKVDSGDVSKRLEGAEFTLYAMKDGVIGEAITAAVTDEEGQVVFTDLTMGDYCIKETKAPYGYKLWTKPLYVNVDAEGVVSIGGVKPADVDSVFMVMLKNERIFKDFTIKKIDADTLKPLSGAKFRISGPDGTSEYVSDEKGLVKLSLPYGDYVIEEIIAPDGYVRSTAKHTLTVSDAGMTLDGSLTDSAVFEMKNEAVKFPFMLYKKDSSVGKALSGAEFTVKGMGVSLTLSTDEYGFSKPVMLRPGEYTVTETKAPSGYKQPLTGWTLTVSEDGTMSIDGKSVSLASGQMGWVASVTNTPVTPPPTFVKTGESGDRSLLMLGTSLTLASFAGLLCLAIDEIKRRKSCAGL